MLGPMQQENNFSRKYYYLYLIGFLGLLSAFGPFITDMYLPTLPAMVDVFKTSATKVQIGLTTSLIGLALGQLIFGSLSDKYGRKPIIIGSLVLFSISSVASIYSPGIDFFNFCRFFQGLGGAGGVVISRSVATDCFTGRELTKTMAIIASINSVAPVVAPVTGGLVAESLGWQGIFWILFAIGIFILCFSYPYAESLPLENRQKGKITSLFKNFGELFKIKKYVLLVIIYVISYIILFAYISSSSFIVENYFGLSEVWFSLIFAMNAIAMGIGSGIVMKFQNLSKAIFTGCLGLLTVSIAQLIFHYLFDNLFIYESITLIMCFFLGLVFTSAATMAMDAGRVYTGSASAILGSLAFLFGGLVSPLVSLGNILSTTFIIILSSSALATGISLNFRNEEK